MYKVEKDSAKNLVRVQMSGFFTIDEANSLVDEFKDAIYQFKHHEPVLLVNTIGFNPAFQDVAAVLKQITVIGTGKCKKVASVVVSAIVFGQGYRLSSQAGVNDKIIRFRTEKEAVDYLLS